MHGYIIYILSAYICQPLLYNSNFKVIHSKMLTDKYDLPSFSFAHMRTCMVFFKKAIIQSIRIN